MDTSEKRIIMKYRPLLALLNFYGISTLSLARVAGLDILKLQAIAWAIIEVDPETAEQVVSAFNRMTGGSFTGEQLGIHVVVEGQMSQVEKENVNG